MSIVSDASALINPARIGKQRYTFERSTFQRSTFAQMLGWQPGIDLRTGLQETWQWFNDRPR